MKTAFITGATSGIGEATAHLFAKNDMRLILCGRRKDRLIELKEKLGKITDVYTLSFDVSERKAVKDAVESLPKAWREIDILINNAGNAHGLSQVHNADIDDWDAMIDINVKGLLYVSRAIIPGMVERNSGHIINIGSIAGKEVYPNGNVYCASKFAVDAISKGMMIDLNEYDIRVSEISPGLVDTEFSKVRFKGNEEKAASVYKGMTPLYAEDIAEIIQFVVSRPKHVNLADILVLPTDQAAATVVNRK